MATIAEKISQLAALVGEETALNIYSKASATEKEAIASGTAFKEIATAIAEQTATAEKGKKPMIDDEEDLFDMGDDEDEEDMPMPKKGKKKEAQVLEDDVFSGDLPLPEFKEFVGGIVRDEINAALTATATKEAQEITALKEQNIELAKMVKAVYKELKTVKQQVTDLSGVQPSAPLNPVNGYRPTQDANNVFGTAQKEEGQQASPVDEFLQGFVFPKAQ